LSPIYQFYQFYRITFFQLFQYIDSMIIIGEKINGFIPASAKAIRERDEAYIRSLAISQAQMGADYLDVSAGANRERERETLEWLINIIQDSVDTPLCIDSPDTSILLDMIRLAKRPGILNSVSEENGKCDAVFPKIADSEWKVIALACDNKGISTDAAVKFDIAAAIVEKAKKYGIGMDRLFIDPLVSALCANGNSLLNFIETTRAIKKQYPDIHITSGLSNISFGMPHRTILNQLFLALAQQAGMDSAILDITSEEMRSALYAADALLGRDRNCRRYLNAYRKGLLGLSGGKND
jgi:5-methyltetrahydrofolate--homocysteine methyltransferase